MRTQKIAGWILLLIGLGGVVYKLAYPQPVQWLDWCGGLCLFVGFVLIQRARRRFG
jgi:hypothetical protein